MTLQALQAPRFVRRTRLGQHEYRKNFHQIDREILAAVTSEEADQVTPLMSKIYLRIVNAPERLWEREGVLRIEAEERAGKLVTAWVVLCDLLGVSSATASKAMRWMHEQGIVGYFAGKNGVGIRVFINRAASSIGTRARGEKILEFPRASSQATRASLGEAAFKDSFADPESLDTDIDPRAPKDGAEQTGVVKEHPDPNRASLRPVGENTTVNALPPTALRVAVSPDEIVSRLCRELAPSLQAAARHAAAREHERTREWLESRGLPKAARVAQREAFNVLRRYGVIRGAAHSSQAGVGRSYLAPDERQPLSDGEVEGLAQACVAMLEVKGQSVELTLSEMSAEAGGFLPPQDAARVRRKVNALLAAHDGRGMS